MKQTNKKKQKKKKTTTAALLSGIFFVISDCIYHTVSYKHIRNLIISFSFSHDIFIRTIYHIDQKEGYLFPEIVFKTSE